MQSNFQWIFKFLISGKIIEVNWKLGHYCSCINFKFCLSKMLVKNYFILLCKKKITIKIQMLFEIMSVKVLIVKKTELYYILNMY